MEMIGVWESRFLKNILFFRKSEFSNLSNLRYDLETLGKSLSFPNVHPLVESSCVHLLPSYPHIHCIAILFPTLSFLFPFLI